MKKGTPVIYKCNEKIQTTYGQDVDLFKNSEKLEVVHWYKLTPYVRVRPIEKGSKNKGIKVRKEYITKAEN